MLEIQLFRVVLSSSNICGKMLIIVRWTRFVQLLGVYGLGGIGSFGIKILHNI